MKRSMFCANMFIREIHDCRNEPIVFFCVMSIHVKNAGLKRSINNNASSVSRDTIICLHWKKAHTFNTVTNTSVPHMITAASIKYMLFVRDLQVKCQSLLDASWKHTSNTTHSPTSNRILLCKNRQQTNIFFFEIYS